MRYLPLIIESMRPRQWIKNLFVFAGLLFTLDTPHTIQSIIRVIAAFFIFCLISGGVYIVNDIKDIRRDEIHPLKKRRPIASGRLPVRPAAVFAIVAFLVSIIVSFLFGTGFGLAVLTYGVMMIAYSFKLKDIMLIDVFVISAGFLLRAVAGAEIIDVVISPWLLVCTTFIALFLGFAKRREELSDLGEYAIDHRPSFENYTLSSLDQLINITAGCTIMSYALYTFLSNTGRQHPYMCLTLGFVIYGMFRYLMLTEQGAGAKNPELLLLNDKPLLIDIALWAAACGMVIHFG